MKYLLIVLIFFIFSGVSSAKEIKIGVLAKRGIQPTLEKWEPTAVFLTEEIKNYSFKIVPLDFDEIHRAVRQKKIDFVIANPAFYVDLETIYGISRIATLKNLHIPGKSYTVFGGTIFTKIDNHSIKSLKDLKGKRFSAVDKNSFGGWLMAYNTLKENNINPLKEFKSITYEGTHDNVVYAVLNKKSDAGTVRTDTLERMEREGKIKLSDFFIINEQSRGELPLVRSTRLYPEWPFAALKHTSSELSQKVSIALMKITENSPAGIKSKSAGWTIPLNYQPVHNLEKYLKVGVYKDSGIITFGDIVSKYWYAMLLVFVIMIITVGITLYVIWLNKNLRSTKESLTVLNNDLEKKVQSRTANIESYLDKERYLRSIMSTVSDINRYLITKESLEELLQITCERFVKQQDYQFCYIGLLENDNLVENYFSKKDEFAEEFFDIVKSSINDSSSKCPIKSTIEKDHEVIINDIMTYDIDSSYRKLIKNRDITSLISFPLKKDTTSMVFGVITVFSSRKDGFEIEEISMLEELSGDIGFAVNSFRQNKEISTLHKKMIKNYEETILGFVKMIEQRDPYTAGHTARVAKYSEMIAKKMNYPKDKIDKLYKAAILHDIGKVSTPDSVLLKPSHLNSLEYGLIQQHVSVGYEMLKNIEFYKELIEIMRYHHERYDGTGYPNGLKGEEIPEPAAIMAVSDAFDAMTSNRIYKKSKSVEDAIKELIEEKGKQFNPKVVDIAAEVFKDIKSDSTINQNPKTDVETERLAYFYKDSLTGLFNEDYLLLLLNQKDYKDKYRYCALLKIRKYENHQVLNEVLKSISLELLEKCHDIMTFRRGDDDIILFSNDNENLNLSIEIVKNNKSINGTKTEITSNQIDLYKNEINSLL